MNVNPYSPPSMPDQAGPNVAGLSENSDGVWEFHCDTTIAGVRRQRASPWHAVFDIAMALITIAFFGSFTVMDGTWMNWICVLWPGWYCFVIIWLASFSHRRGDDFAVTCPGLIGKVHGRIAPHCLEILGPQLRVASERKKGDVVFTTKAVHVKVPGTEQVLRIRPSDLTADSLAEFVADDVESSDPFRDDITVGLLRRADNDDSLPRQFFSGLRILHGHDLVGLKPHQVWRSRSIIAGGLSILALLLAAMTMLQIPPSEPWFIPLVDRVTSPYAGAIIGMYLLTTSSIPLAGISVFYARKLKRVCGEYQITVAPHIVSVAKADLMDRSGLVGDGLNQVQWTSRGLKILGRKDRLLFLMPARWFEEHDQAWLAAAFGRDPEPVTRDCYFGPRLR